MGRGQFSQSFLNMFRPKKERYQRIYESSDSHIQPLLYNNHNQFKEELEHHHDIQVFEEKFSVLDKEIGALKSNIYWLEIKLQSKAKEGNNQHEAITSLEQKVDRLKKHHDDFILAQKKAKEGNNQHEAITSLEQKVDKLKKHLDDIILAQKKETTKQGRAIFKIEETNSNLEKKVAELETRVNKMTSSMVDLMVATSELQDRYSSNSQEAPARLPFMIQISETDLVTICFFILVVFVSFSIGKNLKSYLGS